MHTTMMAGGSINHQQVDRAPSSRLRIRLVDSTQGLIKYKILNALHPIKQARKQ
jgi:hypothetical protein